LYNQTKFSLPQIYIGSETWLKPSISVLLALLAATIVAYALTPLVRSLAQKYGVIAHPGGRRVHARPTPLLGGIAMYFGFLAGVLIVAKLDPGIRLDRQIMGIIAGATVVALMGIVDDRFELPGWAQILSILAGGIVLVSFGVQVRYVTNPFQGGQVMWLGAAAIPVTLVWVLMVTKAVDCMDGLDGLAAGISVIAAGTLTLMALRLGVRFEASGVMSAALAGAALGFLRYNYPPAKIFMGTVGAQFLGFTLAAISVAGAFKIATLVAIAAPILVLGVPLFDTTFVVLRRAVNGRRIDEADTTHLHHRLLNRGLSHRQVVWSIYALTFVLCSLAYGLFCYVK
jgi:UDP-GlcNAc:undecaprenyl-phosphate GlcNAc-1-phosphate transferase